MVLGTKGGAEDIGRTMDKTQSSTSSSLSELSKGRIVFYVNEFLLCALVAIYCLRSGPTFELR